MEVRYEDVADSLIKGSLIHPAAMEQLPGGKQSIQIVSAILKKKGYALATADGQYGARKIGN